MTPLVRWRLAAIGVAIAASDIVLGLFRHWHFGSGYDLAIFDQAVWHMSRFEVPASTISRHANILGDHFSPLLALLAPLYWVAPAPETLIVAQAILLAVSIVPVFLFVRDRLPEGAALGLCGAYGLFWGLQRTALSDVHELAFAPLLVGIAILALDRRRWALLWIASALLMLVKEDLIPVAASCGLYAIALGHRRRGAWLFIVSLLVFGATLTVIIPWFNQGAWSTGGAFAPVWQRPWDAPLLLFSPPQKLWTAALWLAPFLFLPVFSPFALLVVPIGAERLLSTVVAHWGVGGHYAAPLAPMLVMSAGDGLARIARRLAEPRARLRLITGCVWGCGVASAILPGHQPLWLLFRAEHYRARPDEQVAREALAAIPFDASVVAQAAIAPHLTHRSQIYVLSDEAPDAAYVIGSTALDPWPTRGAEAIAQILKDRRQRGYVAVFERDGWVVLRHP